MAGNRRKYGKDKFFNKISHTATSGVVGDAEYQVHGENALRVVCTFTTSGTLTIQGRIENSATWDNLGTLAAAGDTDEFDIGSYDFVRFNFTVAAGSTGEIAASGFFKGSSASAGGGAANSFTIFQTDAGTSPTADSATDTITFTSSDASITVTGNSTTDTVDLVSVGGGTEDITFSSSALGTIPLTLTGSASQTADLLRVEDSTNTQVGGFKADGSLLTATSVGTTTPSISVPASTYEGIRFVGTGSNNEVHLNAGTVTSLRASKNGATVYSGQYAVRSDPTGSTGIPSFAWRADGDTGMYRVSANIMAFTSGNTQTMELSSTVVESKLPLMVPAYATGSLPTASSYTQCIVYDSTTNEFKGSDGTTWNVLG